MKNFLPQQLDEALDLYEHVEANRWAVADLKSDELLLQCQLWAFTARAILDGQVSEPDRQACLWVLAVVTAIARTANVFVFGLSKRHEDDWAARARTVAARLRARRMRKSEPQSATAQAIVRASPRPTVLYPAPTSTSSFPALAGSHVLIVGGVPDPMVMHRYRDAEFTLEWVSGGNVRQIQALAERTQRGFIGGLVFLTDLNRHASFDMLRKASRISSTPMVLSSRGGTSIEQALHKLNQEKAIRKSA